MQMTENAVAQALGKLTESSDRTWSAIDRLNDNIDAMRGDLARIDVEATVERELRRQRATTNPGV